MSGKRSWKDPSRSIGAIVVALPEIRSQYGDAIGGLFEFYRDRLIGLRERPSAQDTKGDLQSLAKKPLRKRLAAIDTQTEFWLIRAAYAISPESMRRGPRWDEFSAEQVSTFATRALEMFQSNDGRPPTDEIAVQMVEALLRESGHPPYSVAAHALIRDALRTCKLSCGDDTIKRLISEIGKVS
jgi:hypothetical protein